MTLKKGIHRFTDATFTMLVHTEQSLGSSATRDNGITRFAHYKKWLQGLMLLLGTFAAAAANINRVAVTEFNPTPWVMRHQHLDRHL